MSYSSQVTSVLPMANGLTVTSLALPSLSLIVTLPPGTCTRSNFTTELGILISSVETRGFSCASATPPARHKATNPLARDNIFRMIALSFGGDDLGVRVCSYASTFDDSIRCDGLRRSAPGGCGHVLRARARNPWQF